ncbi:MAG: M1 family aminopeptidase [Microcoleaceae cyanobacterium]
MSIFFDAEPAHKSFELPGARPHYNPDRPGQVAHIFLDLGLDIKNQCCAGTCHITLNPVRSVNQLTLDAVDLNIKAVTVNGELVLFAHDRQVLDINLNQPAMIGEPLQIAIAYEVVKPRRGIYFIQPDEYYPDKPTQVWTQGEDEDSRFWFPCFDYPGQLATSEIRVKVPANMLAISNGELIKTELTSDGKTDSKIYHWLQKQVHPSYLITLAVGEFAEFKDEWQGKPVTYYVEKNRADDAKRSMGKTPQMIEFFSEFFGYPYPYPKYAQVCVDDFIFGGMENTSTTILTDRCLLDERASIDNRGTESLVAHELAHQWFGDLIVIKHWSHAWIKEGMATYSEVLWTHHEYGVEDAAYYRLQQARNYLDEDASRYRRPIVTHVYREAIELYDRHLYEKGACVYHILRTELGDDLFKKAITTFIQNHAHQTVETVDLLRAIDQATGKNLLFLFDQYVYRGGHPDYKVSYSWDEENKLAKVTVTQTQASENEKDLFDLKIPIAFNFLPEIPVDDLPELEVKGKKSSQKVKKTESNNLVTENTYRKFKVRIHEKEQSFYFPLDQKPSFISFDQGNNFLKTVTLEYPVNELKAQLQYDPDPVSRIYASIALAKKGGLEAVQSLAESLVSDRFWGVRVEVAKQLVTIKLDQVFDALLPGLCDADARVRRSVVECLGEIKTQASYKALKPIVENGDASYYVEASACIAIGKIAELTTGEKPSKEKVIKLLKNVLETKSGWNEVVRSGAIAGLSQMKTSEDVLDIILKYTAPGTPQPLRLSAIRALGSISSGQTKDQVERILQQLDTLAHETFFLTQISVLSALSQIAHRRAIAILQNLAEQTADGRVSQRAEEAIKTVQKQIGSDEAIKQLRQELDQLKQQNQDLRSRLEDLEAKAKK